MSNKKKQKKKKRNKKYAGRINSLNVKYPRVFFKKLGIKPIIKPGEEKKSYHIEQEILKRFDQRTVDDFVESFDNSSNSDSFSFCHSDLELTKIWYGADFYHLCRIASELSKLSIPPKVRILDIGGGPGHLAFWVANIWEPSIITVADIHSKIGSEWAKLIGENRVEFVDSTLPELKNLTVKNYEIILMSRVLSFIDDLGLPDGIPNIRTEDYLASQEAAQLLNNLYDIACRLTDFIKPNGRIIMIESWSDARILLIGRAFERAGLHMNLNLFDAERVARDHSAIVFSANIGSTKIDDLPKALSTGIRFTNGDVQYTGLSAETLFGLFRDGKTKMILEYESVDGQIKMYNEIIEKEGLVLLYRASNEGSRKAWLFPGLAIPKLLSDYVKLERDLIIKNDGKIINKVLPD
jgi:2-polyprenyl-3-methyl-5-hydroxy-6-metoxy-1,4-benzoquinol methylase